MYTVHVDEVKNQNGTIYLAIFFFFFEQFRIASDTCTYMLVSLSLSFFVQNLSFKERGSTGCFLSFARTLIGLK